MVVALAALAGCRPTPLEPSSTEPTAAEPAAVASTPTETRAPDALPPTPPPTAVRTESGVAIEIVARDDEQGPPPGRGDELELRFRVWDEAGKLVGASAADRTEVLELAWLPPGWREAMLVLHEGDRAHIWVPAALAYPDGSGPSGALSIDVELVAIVRKDTAVAQEVPIGSPPANALRTASGLYFVVLREGTGHEHPRRDSTVTVHYEGWTTDGKSFDSSYTRGRPASFPLDRVIDGWSEAVPLMLEGEKTRFWIPAELAYGSSPGRPQGMLVFDIELISIDD